MVDDQVKLNLKAVKIKIMNKVIQVDDRDNHNLEVVKQLEHQTKAKTMNRLDIQVAVLVLMDFLMENKTRLAFQVVNRKTALVALMDKTMVIHEVDQIKEMVQHVMAVDAIKMVVLPKVIHVVVHSRKTLVQAILDSDQILKVDKVVLALVIMDKQDILVVVHRQMVTLVVNNKVDKMALHLVKTTAITIRLAEIVNNLVIPVVHRLFEAQAISLIIYCNFFT